MAAVSMIAVGTVVFGVAAISGTSSGTVRHDARCAALHARAQSFQDAADSSTDLKQKARYQHRANQLEAQANRCDAHPATTSTT